VVITGAKSASGLQLVEQGLARQYSIIAGARTIPATIQAINSNFLLDEVDKKNLQVVYLDLMRPETIPQAIKGADTVVLIVDAPIGWNFKMKNVHKYENAYANLVKAIRSLKQQGELGPSRILTYSGAIIFDDAELRKANTSSIFIALKNWVFGDVLHDIKAAADRMKESTAEGIQWTSILFPHLIYGPLTGKYRVEISKPIYNGFDLSRADAAHFVYQLIDNEDTYCKEISVAY